MNGSDFIFAGILILIMGIIKEIGWFDFNLIGLGFGWVILGFGIIAFNEIKNTRKGD